MPRSACRFARLTGLQALGKEAALGSHCQCLQRGTEPVGGGCSGRTRFNAAGQLCVRVVLAIAVQAERSKADGHTEPAHHSLMAVQVLPVGQHAAGSAAFLTAAELRPPQSP